MTISGEDYVIARRKKIERRQRIVTIVSMISFFGSGAFTVIPALQQASHPKPVTASAESGLQHRARGFELVLQREPQNRVALEGLAMARIQLKDAQGAIPPLEKLVKLQPERQDYKQVLEQVKKQVGKGEQQTNKQQKPN